MNNRIRSNWLRFLRNTPKRKLTVYVLVIFVVIGSIFLVTKQIFRADESTTTNWYLHGPGMGGRVPKITVDQTSPNIIYAGTDVSGALKSIDSGESWFPINNGLNNYDNGGIAVDFENHDTIYSTTDTGLYKSLNGGEEWTLKSGEIRVNKWIGNSGAGTVSISQSKSNPDVLYAISWEGKFYTDPDNYKFWVYKSTDHGESWVRIPGANPNVIQPIEDKAKGNILRAIMTDPSNENIVYIGGDKGLYRTLDGGGNWGKVSGLDSKINFSLGYADGSTDINQLDDTSVIKNICKIDTTSADSGSIDRCVAKYNPAESDSPPRDFKGPRDVRSIAFNPYNSNQIFVLSAWGHIFKSDDMGVNWDEVYHRDYPIASYGHVDSTKNFAWDDRDWLGFDSNNYNSTYPRHGLFESIKIDVNPDQNNIDICKANLSGCDYYIYINSESGESRGKEIWRINSSNIHLNAFSQPSSTTATVFGDNELWEPVLSDDKTGGNLSRNDWTFGKAWNGFSGVDMFDLDLSSSYPNRTIYASGMWGAAKGVASQKYKTVPVSQADGLSGYSYNYDWNWSWKGLENTGQTEALYDPLDPNFIYFTFADHGFVRSKDGGKTFERSISGIKTSYPNWGTEGQDSFFGGWGHALAVSVSNGLSTVYAGLSKWGYSGGTLFKSIDHGENWTSASGSPGTPNSLPPELPNGGGASIESLIIDPSDSNRIFLSYNQIYSSHQNCIEAYEACNAKDNPECSNIYSPANLDTWKAQTCENPQNLAIWSTTTADGADNTGRRIASVNLSNPIWTTGDGGSTWQAVKKDGLPTSSWGTVAYDSNSDSLYFGTFDFSCDPLDGNCHGYGLYKLAPFKNSSDPSVKWVRLNTAVTHKESLVVGQKTIVQKDSRTDAAGRVLDLKINPFNNNEIMAITQGWLRNTTIDATPDSFLIRSKDAGQTWEELAVYPATGIGKITYDPYRENRVAVNLNNSDNGGDIGFLISDDNGETWTENKNLPSLLTTATAFHPTNPLKIALGTSGNGIVWSYNVSQYTLGVPIINKTNLPNQIDFSKQKELDLTGTAPANSDISIVFEKETVSQNNNFITQVESSIIGQALADSNKQTFSAKTDASGNWSTKIDLTKLSLSRWDFYAFASLYDDVSANTNTITIVLANGSSNTNLNVSGNNNSSSVSDNSSLKNNSNSSAINGGKTLYKTGPENFWIAVGLSVVAGLFIVL